MSNSEHEAARARQLYDEAPCGLVCVSAAGLIVEANHTFCRWLGYGCDEVVHCKGLQELLTAGSRIFYQTHLLPLLQMQGSYSEVQLELVSRVGTLPVLINAVRHRGPGDEMHDAVAVFVATDRRKYEQELLLARRRADELLVSERAAQEELNAVLRSLEQGAVQRAVLAEQLIGIVSHDLRTPLNAVLLGTSLLSSSGVTAAQARTLTRIISATNRANRLIEDLLDFTQARLGGGLRVNPKPMNLHVLVDEALEEYRLASPGREFEHRRAGDGACVADADRLAQIVSNLINNAVVYGASDRPITVCSTVTDDELGIEVHNFGAVIPAELLPHLFEPLRRGEQELKRGSRSVGLGLYIVQQLARAHGGDVRVTSSLAEGTTFFVTARH